MSPYGARCLRCETMFYSASRIELPTCSECGERPLTPIDPIEVRDTREDRRTAERTGGWPTRPEAPGEMR